MFLWKCWYWYVYFIVIIYFITCTTHLDKLLNKYYQLQNIIFLILYSKIQYPIVSILYFLEYKHENIFIERWVFLHSRSATYLILVAIVPNSRVAFRDWWCWQQINKRSTLPVLKYKVWSIGVLLNLFGNSSVAIDSCQ